MNDRCKFWQGVASAFHGKPRKVNTHASCVHCRTFVETTVWFQGLFNTTSQNELNEVSVFTLHLPSPDLFVHYTSYLNQRHLVCFHPDPLTKTACVWGLSSCTHERKRVRCRVHTIR